MLGELAEGGKAGHLIPRPWMEPGLPSLGVPRSRREEYLPLGIFASDEAGWLLSLG